jgi:thiamine-phosphate pyrophosphorylase
VSERAVSREKRAPSRWRFLQERSVYAIASVAATSFPLEEVVRRIVDGGALAVQLREKALPEDALVGSARSLLAVLASSGVPLILNDRIDLVAKSGAAGVHLGVADCSWREARRLLGPNAIVGATAHSIEEALAAERAGADYLGAGPIFASQTKMVSAARGVGWLSEIVRAVGIPVFAIGGIRLEHVPAILATGAHGIAVCETLLAAAEPQRAARDLTLALRSEPPHA